MGVYLKFYAKVLYLTPSREIHPHSHDVLAQLCDRFESPRVLSRVCYTLSPTVQVKVPFRTHNTAEE